MESSEPIQFLESQRVYLRPLESQDLDLYYAKALWNSKGRKLTGTQTVFSRLSVQKWLENISEDITRIDLLICLKENREPIGELALMEIDQRNRNAVLRISIFEPSFWGKGYGTEAMSLLLEYGFRVLNLHRVGLDVYAFNHRAIRSYEKLGFQREGIIRDQLFYDGKYHDAIIMGVLKHEFKRVEH